MMKPFRRFCVPGLNYGQDLRHTGVSEYKKTIRIVFPQSEGERGAISVTPRLQPGDQQTAIDKEPVLTVFILPEDHKPLETVQGIIL
jgi:predicted HTH transcriptional regulator